MISELETIEEKIILAVRDRLLNKVGALVGNRIYILEEAPIECEYPYLLVNDGGVDFPTPDRQGQLQMIPDFYIEIFAFGIEFQAEDPVISTAQNTGLAVLLGKCLTALYKQDLGMEVHYLVPVSITRSSYFREEGMEMDRMAKSKALRMLARKRINTQAA